MINIEISRIKLVRESRHKYNILSKRINGPIDAAQMIAVVLDLEHEAQEVLCEICLDVKNQVTAILEVSRGTLSASVVHPREIFRGAILHNSAAVIIFHNHPSGDTTPSTEDIDLTRRLTESGKILDIPLLDHIIIGKDGHYTSLKERGIINV